MIKKTMRLISVSTVLTVSLCAAFMAQAQTVYRCNDSYSDKPCPGATTVKVNDKRSADQKSDADKTTRHDQQAAKTLEKERLQQEAASQRNSPTAAPSSPTKPTPAETKKIHKIRSYKEAAPQQPAKKIPVSKTPHSTDAATGASPAK
jgi:hypothetical protein